ncbi:lipoprotein [Enterobacter cloacae complex sp. IR5422]|uniref:lipoprotein n=1 Tax=Enterobacter cloacae complex sp. IR5422 TaxID=3412363 RepID=UPI003BA06883
MDVNAGHERTSKARIIHQIQPIRGITYVYDGLVCFTVDKKDILSRYVLASNGKDYSELLKGDFLALSYPNTCFNVNLTKGTVYGAHYTLNKKNFYYTFIIDNQGNILDLGRK